MHSDHMVSGGAGRVFHVSPPEQESSFNKELHGRATTLGLSKQNLIAWLFEFMEPGSAGNGRQNGNQAQQLLRQRRLPAELYARLHKNKDNLETQNLSSCDTSEPCVHELAIDIAGMSVRAQSPLCSTILVRAPPPILALCSCVLAAPLDCAQTCPHNTAPNKRIFCNGLPQTHLHNRQKRGQIHQRIRFEGFVGRFQATSARFAEGYIKGKA